MYLFDIL